MGCTSSNESQQNKYPLQPQKPPEKINSDNNEIIKSKSDNIRLSQSKLKTTNISKKSEVKQAPKLQKNMHSSTKSLKKQQNNQNQPTAQSMSYSRQTRLSLSPSKFKLKAKQIQALNDEQQVNMRVSTQKKKRKVKHKKTELDPRIGQLMKIYAL